jgi:hypothetical protein
MVSINKDNQQAITNVSNFISMQWQEESNRYINIDYDSINKTEYKINCLSEQQYVCCYCSREIENTPQTELEHIIPRSIHTPDSLQRYLDFSPILLNNIILQEDFRKSTEEQNTPPFPHHIAYQNIVASCNGKIKDTSENITCCNRKREDTFIPPFNLMPKSIKYLKDGSIYYENDEIDNRFINSLNLNKVLLKKIRRIWFLFTASGVTLDDLLKINTLEQIKEIITLHIDINPLKTVADSTSIHSFKNEANWKMLMNYKYFFNYFIIPNH